MESWEIVRDGTRLQALWQPGDGTPLVILPGVMTDAKGWRRAAAAIGHPGPVLILNRRGRTPSGPLGAGYGVETEVLDLLAWLDRLDAPVRVVGWSYGGLVALEAATRTAAVRHVIAYEPVVRPFGLAAAPALRAAVDAGDLDRAVEVIILGISGYPPEHVAALRADPAWTLLRSWAAPAADELAAVNSFAPDAERWTRPGVPVDLVIGENSRDTAPYGTAFTAIAELLPHASVHVLPGQGHLAHAEAPEALGKFLGTIITGRK